MSKTALYRERAEIAIQRTGARLQAAINSKTASVAQLSEELGVPRSNIYRFLAGKGGLGARAYFAICLWLKENERKDADGSDKPAQDPSSDLVEA